MAKRPSDSASSASKRPKEWGTIPKTRCAAETSNPIRKIVDQMVLKPETTKEPIPLSIGDPCTDGNLLPPQSTLDALVDITKKCLKNGYPPSAGYDDAREAVAKRYPGHAKHPCDKKDVFLASGASHAIQITFDALLEPGDNILLPCPGFSLYQTICDSKGYKCKFYSCVPERSWECNLDEMRAAADERTKAIFITNPSNPCGSNFSRKHLQDIVRLAEELKLPIVSDEIYTDMVFEGETFTSVAEISETVPCIVIGGIAKQYIVPGWRVGWAIIHDRNGVLSEVRQGFLDLTTLILGPNSLIQAVLPTMLSETPKEYYNDLNKTLSRHAKLTYDVINGIEGLRPVKPQGAMYLMVGIDMARFPAFKTEVEFSRELLREQAVMVLPGSVFNIQNFFRIVFTKPEQKLVEACERIKEFCDKYRK
eukprot:Sspe_Gene.4885::Locus_1613_Transcript_1_1_Confidence_1.000_Length_1361::g.4885::m.4885/K00815/TAT; tyrosine aminotransferase